MLQSNSVIYTPHFADLYTIRCRTTACRIMKDLHHPEIDYSSFLFQLQSNTESLMWAARLAEQQQQQWVLRLVCLHKRRSGTVLSVGRPHFRSVQKHNHNNCSYACKTLYNTLVNDQSVFKCALQINLIWLTTDQYMKIISGLFF